MSPANAPDTMPTSRPNHIPTVLGIVAQLDPSSLLDVGVGFGKWGHLFREYLDAAHGRYERESWTVRIDGIEGHEPYLTPMHRYLYDEVHVGDMRALVPTLDAYDVVFMGDVIEHVSKEDGTALLEACLDRANKAVVVTTPASFLPQEAVLGNELEIHRSHWSPADFRALSSVGTTVDDNDTRIVVMPKSGVPVPPLRPQRRSWWTRLRNRLRNRGPS